MIVTKKISELEKSMKKRESLTRKFSTLILGSKKGSPSASEGELERIPPSPTKKDGRSSPNIGRVRSNSIGNKRKAPPEKTESPIRRSPSTLTREALVANNIIQERQSESNSKSVSKTEQLKFGVPLTSLLSQGREIPLLVLTTTSYLHKVLQTQGLFFFENENKPEVLSVKELIEKGKVEISEVSNPHVLAGLLKLFFVELPEPLLTFDLYDAFIFAQSIEDAEHRNSIMRSVVFNLPPKNRVLLQYLTSFLRRVAEFSYQNLMDTGKLSRTFGPILLKPRQITAENMTQASREAPFVIENIMKNYSFIFLSTQSSDIKFTLKEGSPIVKSGKLESLLYKVLDEYYRDEHYKDILLSTFPNVVTPMQFLNKLIELFMSFNGQKPTLWTDKFRISILKFLKMFIQKYKSTLRNDKALSTRLSDFAKTYSETQRLLPSIHAAMEPDDENETDDFRMKSFRMTHTNIFDWSIDELAKQLCLIEHKDLTKLDVTECLKKAFTQPEKSPTFTALTKSFNQRSYWIATEIAKRDNMSARVEALSYFIKLAETCKDLQNYNSAFSIIAALNFSSISRLKQTWSRVPKDTMKSYEKLMTFFDMRKNYKTYRDGLKKAEPPIVPYIALYPKYLFSIEENNPHEIDGMINFAKLRLIHQIMIEIQNFQQKGYSFERNDKIQIALNTLEVVDEDVLYNLSLKCEPKEKEQLTTYINPLFKGDKKKIKEALESRSPKASKQEIKSNTNKPVSKVQVVQRDIEDKQLVSEQSETIDESGSTETDDFNLTDENFVSLEEVLDNAVSSVIFEEYLESLGKKNLFTFLGDVDIYTYVEDPVELSNQATAIYQRYFEGEEKISFPDDIAQQLKEKANLFVFNSDTFELAHAWVWNELEKTYLPQMVQSKAYVPFLQIQKSKEDEEELKKLDEEQMKIEQEEKAILKREQELLKIAKSQK